MIAKTRKTMESACWQLAAVCLLIVCLTGSAALAQLQQQAQALLQQANLGQTQVGLLAVDLASGQVLIQHQSDLPLIPASNMKLVTTAAAARLLGPDFMFRTELILIQPDQPGQGVTLLVRGDGDPAFGDPVIMARHGLRTEQLVSAWVQAVRQADVSHVNQILIDDRVFDRQFIHDTWPVDQLNRWYCAQVAGLNFHLNCLAVYPVPTAPDRRPQVNVYPQIPGMVFRNRAITAGDDTFWISRRLGTNEFTFHGRVQYRREVPVQVTVHDPPMVFGRLLAEELIQAGVEVGSIERPGDDEVLPAGQLLHVVQTSLPTVMARSNKDSHNLFADALFKRIGHEVTRQPGSFDTAAMVVRLFVRDQAASPHQHLLQVADGSGMSRDNRVTARLMVDLLQAMHDDPELGTLYRDSLAIGGQDGTLRRRFSNPMAGTVYAKSGYLRSVSGLSGYLVLPSDVAQGDWTGEPRGVAFSFLFNGFDTAVTNRHLQRLQDSLVNLLDGHLVGE